MRRLVRLVALIAWSFAVPGCGDDDSGENSCGSAEPCGGDLEGTWQLDEVCQQGDALTKIDSGDPHCAGMHESVLYQYSGTISFESGLYNPSISQTLTSQLRLTPECHGGALDEETCASIESSFRNSDQPTVANCVMDGKDCLCRTTTTYTEDGSEPYVVHAEHLLLTKTRQEYEYCVNEDKMRVWGEDRLSGILLELSLTRTP